MSDLTLRFKDFHTGFNVNENFFVNCLRSSGLKPKIVTNPFEKVDLQIKGPFENRLSKFIKSKNQPNNTKQIRVSPLWQSKYQVFYTGENVRPPFNRDFFRSFSFDQDSLGGRNTYFPLWMFEVDWFDTGIRMSRLNLILKPEILIESRDWPLGKVNEACAFVGNPEPIRLEALHEYRKHLPVTIFGKLGDLNVRDKLMVSKEFTWNICFENDLYPGYVTEKILEAYLCGNIPIYRGILPSESPFNTGSFINILNFPTLRDSAISVSNLSKKQIKNIYEEPLMKYIPNINQIKLDFLSCLPK